VRLGYAGLEHSIKVRLVLFIAVSDLGFLLIALVVSLLISFVGKGLTDG